MKRKFPILLVIAGLFLGFTGASNVSAATVAPDPFSGNLCLSLPAVVANAKLLTTGSLISHQAVSIGAFLAFVCLVIVLLVTGYLKNPKNYAKIRDFCYIMLALICLSSAILATFHVADLGVIILLTVGWAYYSLRIKRMN